MDSLMDDPHRSNMGCAPSKGDQHENVPLDSGSKLKADKYRKQMQTEGMESIAHDQICMLEMRCAQLEAEIRDKSQEIQHIKTGEALSNRNSLKLNRKYTYHEKPPVEIALRETRAQLSTLEEENNLLKSQLQQQSNHSTAQQDDVLDLQLELEELKSDLSKLGEYNQKLLKEKVLLMFCSSMNINMLLAISLWKRGVMIPARSTIDTNTEVERMTLEKEELIHASPLYPSLGKIDFTNVRAMSRTSVILLFESLMDEKYEQDLRDIASGRPLKPATDFLFDYMNRRHGLPAMANKKLAQFVLGLVSMYSSGVPYARVMCGIFNLIKQDTMHANFSTFLTHVRAVFQGLKDKRKRPVERPRSTSNASPKQDYRKEKFEYIDTGGSAPLVYVCDLLYGLFKEFPRSGEVMLRMIKPPDLSIEDFIIFKICHKMAQDGCSPEELFKRLDLDHGGTIDHDEFHQGLQQLMGLWLCDDDLLLAMNKMSPGAGEIPREQFFKFINFDAYYNSAAWKNLTVSGVNFLLAFVSLRDKVTEECADAFRTATGGEEVEFVEFQRALQMVDSSLTHQDTVKIYNSASAEKLDVQAFIDICQNERIGRLKSFGMR